MGGIEDIVLPGIDVITGGAAGVVGIDHLQDDAVARGDDGGVRLDDGGAALDQNGGLVGVEYGAVGDGQLAALIPEAHDAEAAGVHLGVPEHAGGGLVGHDQGIVRHVKAAVLKGVNAVSDGEGAIAAGTGDGYVAVLEVQAAALDAVGGHDAPSLRGQGAVLVPCVSEVGQIGGPAVAPETQHPGNPAHVSGHDVVLVICGQNAVLGGDLAVPDVELGMTACEDSAAGRALSGDEGILHGQDSVVCGGDAGAVADEIVAAVALEGNIRT